MKEPVIQFQADLALTDTLGPLHGQADPGVADPNPGFE